ncbi:MULTISPECIES: ABC transporter permease [unclassified Paenibacillus]|uniref:ABC transporter permease n=1 Tax=unclassified Paenibacillus TaxID=185978 RepID=UPI001C118E11|nr:MULTISPECIES: ABC transporter permease [unclassified Paenibacillus]MBU5444970.1 ABC transporter permease [Paenibacillus sp. MSJ-34]CAH0121273.1 Ribose import permease protein RbsC [Paenibacillus sp. CECT 9249]
MSEILAGLKSKETLMKNQKFILLCVIVLVSAAVGSINSNFFSLTNIFAIFQQVSVLGILTMAMALLLISGGIDLSIGSIMALSGVVISKIMMSGGSVGVAVAAGLAVGLACGLINGLIVSKSKVMPLIITLGMGSVYFGIALIVSEGKFMNFGGQFEFIGRTKFFGIFPFTLVFLFVTVVLAFILLNYTKFGRRIVSIGGNEENAYLSGIPVDRYKIVTYGISGGIAGLASIVLVSRLDSIVATAGQGYELSALTAAIIGGVTFEGGRGTIGGAFLGVVMIGLISNAMTILSVNSYLQTAITGGIIVVAVILSNLSKLRKK